MRKLKIEKDGNDSLSLEHKEEIQVSFHKFMDLITSSIKSKIKSVTYSSQGSHTGQLDFCNWLADGSTTG